jgi:hypothetical protein
MDALSESAWRRARRTFGPTVQSWRFVGWLVFVEAVGASIGVYFSVGLKPWEQAVITAAAIFAAATIAFGSAFIALWVSAPVRQRDEARELVAQLQAQPDFPDVLFKASPPLVMRTRDSDSLPGRRETPIAVNIGAVNRETTRPAILRFAAYAIRPELRPGNTKLQRIYRHEQSKGFLPDPVRIEPLDLAEGEVVFAWDHSMDFLWGRDLSEDDVIDRFMAALHVIAKDEVSTISVEVPLPEGQWYRSGARE